MGKNSAKNNKHEGSKPSDINTRNTYDNDTIIFIQMAQEHKNEGTKLFQKKDYEGAILKYEKALNLLPGNHIDVSYLHSSIASCYMQMGINDFPKAIHECNLALEVTPKYSKALLKRARCYEALNRLDLALRDVSFVLNMEPKNIMAIEIADRVRKVFLIEKEAKNVAETGINELVFEEKSSKSVKEKIRKKKGKKLDENNDDSKKFEEKHEEIQEKDEENFDEKGTEDKLVVNEKIRIFSEENERKKSIKLVYGEDIRWAKIPFNCDILELREIISDRFPLSQAVLMKYRDQEGDLVTITTNEELKWAESTSDQTGSVKLYIIEVNPDQDPFFSHIRRQEQKRKLMNSSSCIDDWILEFSQLFKNYVGFDSDLCLDLHEVGMKLYTEAMEDIIITEEAQELFEKAADKFQEMAALALFNWGNVHISRAKKSVYFKENTSRESLISQLKDSYEWAQMEFSKAGEKYEEAIKVNPCFYEGVLALGYQEFEKAKLSWYYVVGTNINLEKWDASEVIGLYNKAENNIEKGMKMWEMDVTKMDITKDEVANMRARMNILWGTMLYERSIMEYKLGLPSWHECLEIAVEKFEFAGVSHADIGVIITNHCSNDAAPEGLGFDIDEIVQAWNEMYEAKRWQRGVASFRLEPLLRRRASKLFYALKHAQ